MSQLLIVVGAITALLFYAVLIVEGALRPGYNPIYHTGSELSLGKRGWVQRANFLQFGAGMVCFGIGVGQTLDSLVGGVLLGVFGLALMAAGVFLTDPVRGFPPGSPNVAPEKVSWHHQVHGATGPIAYLAAFGACLSLAGRLGGLWRGYTVLTAVVGLGFTVGTALSYQRNSSITGLVQRGLILVYSAWVVLLSIHLLA